METSNTIKELTERRSVRVYEDRAITTEQKEAIIQAAMEAPTAGNQHHSGYYGR